MYTNDESGLGYGYPCSATTDKIKVGSSMWVTGGPLTHGEQAAGHAARVWGSI